MNLNPFIRRIKLIAILLLIITAVEGQVAGIPAAYPSTAPINYVREWDALSPDQSASHLITRSVQDVRQITKYFDGLGRQIQTVIKGTSPAGNDMVYPKVLDNMNREHYKYLPFPSNVYQTGDATTDGNIKLDAFQQQSAFYTGTPILLNQGETYFYDQVNYEPSPLNRVSAAYGAGNGWVGSSKGSQKQYYSNSAADNVQQWVLTASFATIPNTTPPVPISSGFYPAGTLYKIISVDEAGNQVVEFKDTEGKTILKQVQYVASPGTNHSGWLNTYYIYDNLNNLRYVLQPQAVQLLLNAGSWNLSSIPNLLTNLCFYYEFDQRNRMIIKRLPGAQSVYMVYDALDRKVMEQDGNLRASGQWLVSVYDNIDRTIQTGLLTDATSFATELSNAYIANTYPNTSANFQLLTQTYYDNYTWETGTPLSAGFDAAQASSAGFQAASNANYPYPQAVTQTSYTTTGLVTGTKKEILGSSVFLYTADYYDDHDRVIQSGGTNITGGIDEITNQYAFDGKLLVSQTKNIKNGSNTQTNITQSQNTYDPTGRLQAITKVFTGTAGTVTKKIVNYSYNELGEMLNKQLGPVTGLNSGPVDVLTYDYNIRGWYLGVNRSYITSASTIAITNLPPAPGNYFGEELAFDKLNSVSGMTYTAAALNGNIAGTVWKSTGDAVNRKYDFTYDQASRLSTATFSQITPTNAQVVNYTVSGLSYDANGNILGMSQNGYRLGAPAAPVDQLTYTYFPTSNQLQNITDGANNAQTILGDFRYSQAYTTALGGTKTTAAIDYGYDVNGNLNKDLNKDIGTSTANGINYNYLNLPQLITIANSKGTIQYIYDAAGTKLQKITTETSGSVSYNGTAYTGVQIVTTTTYIQGFVYQSISYPNNATLNTSILQHGDVLQFAGHEEGRIRPLYYNTTNSNTVTGYAFDYIIKDHVGNTRMVLTDEQYTDPPYVATMEPANLSAEQQVFGNIPNTKVAKPAPFDSQTANQWVALTNFSGSKIGPSLTLKVMAGDQLSITVNAYYLATSGTNYNVGSLVVGDLLPNLIASNGIPGAGSLHATLADLQSNTAVLNASSQLFLNNRTAPNSGVPKAYLNYVFLDDQFQYAGGYATPVTSASATTAVPVNANKIPVAAPKNGYVYVFVSNESNYNVYFDNLTVTFKRGPVLEDNAYYPFGLAMAGISDKAVKSNYAENKYRFANKELQNKEFSDGTGLDDYDLGARFYDPQIGRFGQIDPLAEYMRRWSPYSYSFDNPIRFTDPNGTDPKDSVNKKDYFLNPDGSIQDKRLDDVVVTGHKSKKTTFWGVVSNIADFVPFVGSIKQIAVGVYDGNWKEVGMGVVMLGVDVLTAGEGGEVLRAGEKGLQILAEDEVKNVAEGGIKDIVEKDAAEEAAHVSCGCFLAGTLVLTDSGYKQIEEIKPGDLVWSYNDTTKVYGKKKVKRIFQHIRDTVYVIHIGPGIIKATSDHPFFVGGRWLKVKELHTGDSVLSYTGKKLPVGAIDIIATRTTVYNFEVDDYHTYYVSTQKVLVHNNGPCDVDFDKLYKDAEKEYPNKAGKTEAHHVEPKYLGGAKNGKTVKIPAAYHQKITNAFRNIRGYGSGKLGAAERQKVMNQVYSKLPLPNK